MLAGASYLDMVWYQVEPKSVHVIVVNTCAKLEQLLEKEISYPRTEEGWRKLADGWKEKSIKAHGFDKMPGTVLAVDGLVIHIRKPSKEDLKGRETGQFYNRKGKYGLIVQAACDSDRKIRYLACKWPGATNDISAPAVWS
jgi:hypothetical protein